MVLRFSISAMIYIFDYPPPSHQFPQSKNGWQQNICGSLCSWWPIATFASMIYQRLKYLLVLIQTFRQKFLLRKKTFPSFYPFKNYSYLILINVWLKQSSSNISNYGQSFLYLKVHIFWEGQKFAKAPPYFCPM